MKALTLYQPYALLIVAGAKRIETRPRKTNIRGTVAVHAAKKPVQMVLDAITSPVLRQKLVEVIETYTPLQKLVYGAVIGTVDVVDCIPVEKVQSWLSVNERLMGDYSPGRYAWILKNPVFFPHPIPATGKQGWWNWENESRL